MKPVLDYTEFKRKLCSNPKWIARGLQVLVSMLPIPGLSQEDENRLNYMDRQLAFACGRGLPWPLDSDNRQTARNFVLVYAPALHKFYRAKLNDNDKSLHS